MIIIREAVHQDAFKIAEIHVKSWQSAYHGLISNTYLSNLSVQEKKHKWEKRISQTISETLVATIENRIKGFISFGLERDGGFSDQQVAEISAVYIHPCYYRQGIGQELMRTALNKIVIQYSQVVLWVLKQNHNAIRFYTKTGFLADGATKSVALDDKNFLNEIRMQKTL